jgi:hypothetical protein
MTNSRWCRACLGHLFVWVLGLAGVMGCSKPASPGSADLPSDPAKYPILVIDAAHLIGKVAYDIAPTAGIYLDLSRFKFTYGKSAVVPDEIQVLLDGTHYRLSPSSATRCRVDGTTVKPIRGGPFPGFRTGSKVIIGIGRSKPEESDSHAMEASWAGMIRVK